MVNFDFKKFYHNFWGIDTLGQHQAALTGNYRAYHADL